MLFCLGVPERLDSEDIITVPFQLNVCAIIKITVTDTTVHLHEFAGN